jgi:hypothetical protein
MNYNKTVMNLRKKTTLIIALSVAIVPVLLLRVNALDIEERNIVISSAVPSAINVTYDLSFRPVTAASVASMRMEFCTNSPLQNDICSIPLGLNLTPTAGTLASQTGNTGFSVDLSNSDSNTLVLTRTPTALTLVQSDYSLVGITNPSSANETVYVRISLHASTDGTGNYSDAGAVAFAMTPTFNVGAYVPPYMTFCVAQTVSINCSVTNGFLLDFGEFNKNTATTATLQFSTATNDISGYNTFVNGQTMTSGNNVIPALVAQTASNPGVSQFGFNLVANANPSVGASSDGVGTGVADANYAITNRFRFANGDRIASSPITTEFTRFTASYIVNIADNQSPGIYASTLSFTSVASF